MVDTKQTPLLSIGLPVKDGGRFLRESLESLLAQEFREFEVVICDNASTDDTSTICKELEDRDPRIRYHRNPEDLGAIQNFTRVHELAIGKYFMWASCHDLWEPSLLGKCTQIMEDDPSVVLCFPRAAEIDENSERIGSLRGEVDTRGQGDAARYRHVVARITGYAVYGVFRREALGSVFPIQKLLGPDALILAELSFLGTFAVIPEELFFLRRLSVSRNWRRYFGNLKIASGGWRIITLYIRTLLAYLRLIRRRTNGASERLLLSVWTVLVHLTRTTMWFIAIVISLLFPRYYRPW